MCVCILEVDGFIISVKINFKSAAILLKQYMETARRATEIMQLLQFDHWRSHSILARECAKRASSFYTPLKYQIKTMQRILLLRGANTSFCILWLLVFLVIKYLIRFIKSHFDECSTFV